MDTEKWGRCLLIIYWFSQKNPTHLKSRLSLFIIVVNADTHYFTQDSPLNKPFSNISSPKNPRNHAPSFSFRTTFLSSCIIMAEISVNNQDLVSLKDKVVIVTGSFPVSAIAGYS